MKKQYKCVAFDLDGTLIDTSEGIYSSILYAVKENGLRELTDEELHTFIGPPLQRTFNKYYGLTGDDLEKVIASYRYIYKKSEMFRARPYDGIFDLLSSLKELGITPVVATYKPQDSAERVLKHFGFDKYTDLFFGADNNDVLKKSDIIRSAVMAAGISDLSEAVMIGDSDNDANGARDAGVDFIGVTYGFGFRTKEDVDNFPNVYASGSTYDLIDYFKKQ